MQEGSNRGLSEMTRYGGCAFLAAWFLLFFSGELWGLSYEYAAESVVTLSLTSISSCFITLAILNILGQKGLVFTKPGGNYFIVLGLLLSIGTVGIAFGNMLDLPFFILSCIAVGCCGAFFICAAVLQIARLTPRNILIACSGIFLVGILIYSFAFYVPRELTVPIVCLLPLLACAFFALDKEDAPQGDNENVEEEGSFQSEEGVGQVAKAKIQETGTNNGWRVVVLLSIFMLFSCVARSYFPFLIDNESFSYFRSFSIIVMLVIVIAFLAIVAVLPDKFSLANVYKGVFLFGVVFFAIFPVFGIDNPVSLVLADGYRGLCALVALAFFACMARQIPFFGFRNVVGALVVYVAFGLAGWLLGSVLHYADLSADVLRIYNSIQCVSVLLAFILLFRQPEVERFVDEGREAELPEQIGVSNVLAGEPDETQQPEKDSGGRWRQRCAEVAKQNGLTLREEEVFILLAKGYKAQNISDRLSVSYNTTRAHIRNIYQKCDIHSQQEFIDLVESSVNNPEK